ncbi:hypothetical protein ACFLU6_09050 [Acidobacteriota bacterium]
MGSCRSELFDYIVVLNEDHLRPLLKSYIVYYYEDRTHLNLEKDAPGARPAQKRPSSKAEVIALPRAGGLHHRYTRAA